jgi:hypothetical protein
MACIPWFAVTMTWERIFDASMNFQKRFFVIESHEEKRSFSRRPAP